MHLIFLTRLPLLFIHGFTLGQAVGQMEFICILQGLQQDLRFKWTKTRMTGGKHTDFYMYIGDHIVK